MSTRLRLFYAESIGNRVHCTLIFWVRVNLGVIVMKGRPYTLQSSKLERHYRIQFSLIPGYRKMKEKRVWFLILCFKWHIKLTGLFNSKTIHVERLYWYYLIHFWVGAFILFSSDISSKVNLTIWLEFELYSYNIAVQHFSHNAMKTTHLSFLSLFYLMGGKWIHIKGITQ